MGNRLVTFDLDGPAEIAAVDNVDPTSLEPFVAAHRKTFQGQCVVCLRHAPGAKGITLTAASAGLGGSTAKVGDAGVPLLVK